MTDNIPQSLAAWLEFDTARLRDYLRHVDSEVALKDRVVATINSVPAIRLPVAEDCDG